MNKHLKSFLLVFLAVFTAGLSFAQTDSLIVTNDSLLCNGTHLLHTSVIGEIPITINNLNVDDQFSGIVPIGFSFNFYGNVYTNCTISANGLISFNTSNANQYSNWSLTGGTSSAMPANTECYNSLCGVFSDIEPLMGGTVFYGTVGTAPYRKFVVSFCDDAMYDCNTQLINFQMVLDETTNTCEVFIHKKYICTDWNGGLAIQGVENSTGSAYTIAPGRNCTQWSATDDGRQFIPNATYSSYTCDTIPYSPIPSANATINWYQGGNFIGSGDTISVNPSDTTVYTVQVVSCDDTTTSYLTVAAGPDVIVPGKPHITSYDVVNPSYCGAGDGKIVLHGLSPGFTDTIFFNHNGYGGELVTTPTIDSTVTIDSTLMAQISACPGMDTGIYNNIIVKVLFCSSDPLGPITMTTLPVASAFADTIHYGCYGDDVSFTNQSTPAYYPLRYLWTFGDGTTDSSANPDHMFHQQGVYNVQLITSSGNCVPCRDTSYHTVALIHPLHASFTTDVDTICTNGAVNFTNTSIDTAATFLWEFGDGNTSTDASTTTHNYNQPGTFTSTLVVTDFVPCQDSASKTIYASNVQIVPPYRDTTFCITDSMLIPMQVNTQGPAIFSNYIYQWTPGDGLGDPNALQPNFLAVGDYNYIFSVNTTPINCPEIDTITLHSNPPPTIDSLTPDQSINYGSSIQLNVTGGYYYFWTPNDGSLNNPDTSSPIASPLDSTTYTVIVMTQLGCRDSAKVNINVINPQPPVMPNAFAPKGKVVDNQLFKIVNIKFQKLVDFSIYNRWGNRVFQTNDPTIGWDGTFNGQPQNMDTYNYNIVVVQTDGTEKSYRGTVTLIR